MIDFDFAHEVMDNCMDVLLKYRITEEHIAELYKRTAILQRFPYAKAIECALLDDDIKICNYVKTHSCVLENTSPIEPDNFTHQLQQEYNRTKARFDHFTNDIRDIVKIDDIYKSLSHSQINQDENTHFSDSFIKQIKYRLLQARFISDGSHHLFGIADWAFREKGVDIYFVQSPCVYNPGHCLYLNRTLDSYMDDIGEVEITIEKAAKILYEKGMVPEEGDMSEGKELLQYLRKYLSSNVIGDCAYIRNKHWYIHRSDVYWPPC